MYTNGFNKKQQTDTVYQIMTFYCGYYNGQKARKQFAGSSKMQQASPAIGLYVQGLATFSGLCCFELMPHFHCSGGINDKLAPTSRRHREHSNCLTNTTLCFGHILRAIKYILIKVFRLPHYLRPRQ